METPIDPKLARATLDRDRYLKAMNDAFDALRDGQAMLAILPVPGPHRVIAAAEAGATAAIQPGGSVRDPEVIRAADERGIAMVFTGVRHFRH